MAYNLHYIGKFDSLDGSGHTLNIFEKDYSGIVVNVIMGGDPVEQTYRMDSEEWLLGIRVATISFQMVNITLDNFLSTDERRYKVQLLKGSDVKFVGWIDNGTSKESIFEGNKIITYTATDGISFLKNIPIDQNFLNLQNSPVTLNISVDRVDNSISVAGWQPNEQEVHPGDRLRIVTTDFDKMFSIQEAIYYIGSIYLRLNEAIPGASSSYSASVYTFANMPIQYELPIKTLLSCALSPLADIISEIDIYSRLENDLGEDFLETWMEGLSFYDKKWQSCYDVIEIIVKGMNAMFYQSGGRMVIRRWYDRDIIQFKRYDIGLTSYIAHSLPAYKSFINVSGNDRSYLFPIGSVTLSKKIDSAGLPYNNDLLQTGILRKEITKVIEGDLNKWSYYDAVGMDAQYIGVRRDSFGTEKERWVQSGTNWTWPSMNVSEGDTMDFSVSLKIYGFQFSANTDYRIQAILKDHNGNKKYWSTLLNRWVSPGDFLGMASAGIYAELPAGYDGTLQATLGRFPNDGELTFSCPGFTLPNPFAIDPLWKMVQMYDWQFDYHIQNIKEVDATSVAISENMANEILDIDLGGYPDYQLKYGLLKNDTGTLYPNSNRNFVQYTDEIMQHRKEFRSRIEGTFLGDYDANDILRTVNEFYVPLNFTIHYRKQNIEGMLIELVKFGENKSKTYYSEKIIRK